MVQLWEVVGGEDSGGIVVRVGSKLSSEQEANRLSYKALIREERVIGNRLQFKKVEGAGPDVGWVSISWKDRPLVVRKMNDSGSSKNEPAKPQASAPQNVRGVAAGVQDSNMRMLEHDAKTTSIFNSPDLRSPSAYRKDSFPSQKGPFSKSGVGVGQSGSPWAGQQRVLQSKETKLHEDTRQKLRSYGIDVTKLKSPQDASKIILSYNQFSSMSITELEEQYKRLNLPWKSNMARSDLMDRLRTWVRLGAFSTKDLIRECNQYGVPIGDIKTTFNDHEYRQKLCDRFVMHRWLFSEYVKRDGTSDLPIGNITEMTRLLQILQECEHYKSLSISELKKQYSNLGFQEGDSADLSKDVLVHRLQTVIVWNALTEDELRKECEQVQRHDEGNAWFKKVEKDVLIQYLYAGIWPGLRGINVERFDSADVASAVSRQSVRIEQLSEAELKQRCKDWTILVQQDTTKEQLKARVQYATMLIELSMPELVNECKDYWNIPIDKIRVKEDDQGKRADLAGLCIGAMNGVPPRFDSSEAAATVNLSYCLYEDLTLAELKERCDEVNLQMDDVNLKRADYLQRLLELAVLLELPMSEIKKDCPKEWDAIVSAVLAKGDDTEKRSHLIDLMFFNMNGVPIERLTTYEAAHSVACQWVEINKMDMEQLKKRCKDCKVPLRDVLEIDQLKARLRYLALGWELPWSGLTKDCEDLDLPLTKLGVLKDGDGARGLILMLLVAVWDGIPIKRYDNAEAAARVANQLALLGEKTLTELALDAKHWNMPIPDRKRQDKEYHLTCLRTAHLYSELPIAELEKECRQCGIEVGTRTKSSSKVGTGKAEKRDKLFEQLMFRLFHDELACMGLPTQKLDTLSGAMFLYEQWNTIQSSSETAVERKYEDLGLAVHSDSVVMRERLKQVALWETISFPELEKQCRERHIDVEPSDSRGDLVRELVRACWAPDFEPSQPRQSQPYSFSGAKSSNATANGGVGGGPQPKSTFSESKRPQQHSWFSGWQGASNGNFFQPPPRRPTNKQQTPSQAVPSKIALYFEALGLPTTAKVQDVKHAYRQLALKHHPDKNPGEEQNSAAKKFLKVSNAYTALMMHLKSR